MNRRRTEIYLLVGLGLVLAAVLYSSLRSPESGGPGVFAENSSFRPLDVQEPQLHLDRLDKLRHLEYTGNHRNIFLAVPPPVALPAGQQALAKPPAPFVGPKVPPPPPPVQVPAEFFGYATRGASGRRVAFFTSGDDVLVVAEGDTFLGRFRLVHIGNDNADIEEIASGRHATVPMVQPPAEQGGQ
jgi:hypothetical protein